MSNVVSLNQKIEETNINPEFIVFEHPLNETVRICLLLEQLFNQAHDDIEIINTKSQSNQAISTLIKLMNVIDRPDLKGKLTKALSQQATSPSQLESNRQVDQKKLTSILNEIDAISDQLHATNNKFGQALKDNGILKTIAQYSSSPGGAANFNTPRYMLWLQQDNKQKKLDLNKWLAEFELIQRTVTILLRLTRHSQGLSKKLASDSFFQINLESNPITQLIRVKIAIDANIWPEISVGRHRLAIYFIGGDNKSELKQDKKNINFELACCC